MSNNNKAKKIFRERAVSSVKFETLEDPNTYLKVLQIPIDTPPVYELVETSLSAQMRKKRLTQAINYVKRHRPELYDTLISIIKAEGKRGKAKWLLAKRLGLEKEYVCDINGI